MCELVKGGMVGKTISPATMMTMMTSTMVDGDDESVRTEREKREGKE